jgi:hypothetical protein
LIRPFIIRASDLCVVAGQVNIFVAIAAFPIHFLSGPQLPLRSCAWRQKGEMVWGCSLSLQCLPPHFINTKVRKNNKKNWQLKIKRWEEAFVWQNYANFDIKPICFFL